MTLSDFDTDFAPLFEPPLRPVERRERLTQAQFEQYRKSQTPVIITGMMDEWPALAAWQDPAYLRQKAGEERIYFRNLAKGRANYGEYTEVYEAMSFGEFIEGAFKHPQSAKYLTQAAVIRPDNYLCCFERAERPGFLGALAKDVINPPYFEDDHIFEANLWIGPGGQMSGLHFDEMDNLNCVITGEKRWVMFPQSEHSRLLAGGTARSSIARGFHGTEKDRFGHPLRRQARGFQCVVRPGQIIFVPRGFWHQVFSGPGLGIALNYWYVRPVDLLTFIPLYARRVVGYQSRVRHTVAMLKILGVAIHQLARYAITRMLGRAIPPPPVGPAGYGPRKL